MWRLPNKAYCRPHQQIMDSMGGASAGVGFTTRLTLFVFIALYGSAAVAVFDAFWPLSKRPAAAASTA